jgi:hypothetical protein
LVEALVPLELLAHQDNLEPQVHQGSRVFPVSLDPQARLEQQEIPELRDLLEPPDQWDSLVVPVR